ncbi:MAG: hypothetical protein JXJ04_01110 [Spirochaetales bacterium]|nr:hypothetical protein [Spirochaetales bacterium]
MIIKTKFSPPFFFIWGVLLLGSLLLSVQGCSKNSSSSRLINEPGLPAATSVLVPVEGFLVYENPEFNIRIQYPGDWEKMEGELGVAFIIPKKETDDPVFQGFNLLFEKMYGVNMNLDEYIRITKEGMKKYMPGFVLIESGETTLGGHPAFQMTFNGVHESKTMKFLSMFTIRDDKVYSFSFNTLPEDFDGFQELVEKMITSFQFLS